MKFTLNSPAAGKKFVQIFHSSLSAWIVLLLSLAFTVAAYVVTSNYTNQRVEDQFLFKAEDITHSIQNRFEIYESVIRGGVGLFNASKIVDRQEFRQYVSSLDISTNWPGIQGYGFAVPLLPAQVNTYTKEIRKSGFPKFEVKPKGTREFYTSIKFIEPFDWRNQRAFGFDMWSNNIRREAMKRARDTGQYSTSGIITLVQETDSGIQKGFLTYLPVYKKGVPLKTISDRKSALVGWVYGAFRANDLMDGIINKKDTSVIFQIFDSETENSESLLYSSDLSEFNPERQFDFKIVKKLDLQGRSWNIHFYAPKGFISQKASNIPTFIAVAAGIIDILLFYVIFVISSLQNRAESIAVSMTSELQDKKNDLDKANHRFTIALEASKVGIWEWEIKTNSIFWQQNMYLIYGVPNLGEKVAFESWLKTIHPKDQEQFKKMFDVTLTKKARLTSEFRIITSTGDIKYIESTIKIIKDKNGTPKRILGVNTDTTAWKKNAIRLKLKSKEIERSNKDLEHFAFAASHDLQEPLRKITSFTEILEGKIESLASDDEDFNFVFSKIKSSAQRMQMLINDLLNYSRIGRSKWSPNQINLKDIVDIALDNLEILIGEKKAEIIVEELPTVWGEKTHLSALFQNLIANALKFQDNKTRPKVIISSKLDEKFVEISVQDNGIGIDPKYCDQIFQLFNRLHGRTKFGGTGIGLAICKKTIEYHGGNIWAESDGVNGTTLKFTLPLQKEYLDEAD